MLSVAEHSIGAQLTGLKRIMKQTTRSSSVLHWIMQEEAATLFKLSCQVSVYFPSSCLWCCVTTDSRGGFRSYREGSY